MKKKHSFKIRVYHHDTDCYNVMWHGAYVKYLEIARVEFIEMLGFKLAQLEAEGVLFPVVDLTLKYKFSAVLNDILKIETSISDLTKTSVEFEHKITNQNEVEILTGKTKIVTLKDGKLQRRFQHDVYEAFVSSMDNKAVLSL